MFPLCVLLAGAACSAQEVPLGLPAPQAPNASPAPETTAPGPGDPRPLAIVSLDTKIVGSAAEVTGAMRVYNGRAFIASHGTITASDHTAQVTLPYRGTLNVCASTSVNLSSDASVPAGEIPGLLMAQLRYPHDPRLPHPYRGAGPR